MVRANVSAKYPATLVTASDLGLFQNLAETKLSAACTSSATTLSVTTTTDIEANMRLRIVSSGGYEIVKVSSVDANAKTLTVVRAQDGTGSSAGVTGYAHPAGASLRAALHAEGLNQLVADLVSVESELGVNLANVALSSRTLTAGSGLTGGGDLTADRTFTVGAGTGITVNADDVAVNLAADFAWTGTHTFPDPKSALTVIVYKDGSTYYARTSKGALVSSGASAATVIQAALDSLTASRTWLERVVTGPYLFDGIDTEITIGSYTVLENLGVWKLAASANINMLRNANTTTGNEQIHVRGGIFDGNSANQSSLASNAFLTFYSMDDSSVQGVTVQNARSGGIMFTSTSSAEPGYRNAIMDCVVKDVYGTGIKTSHYYSGVVSGNRVYRAGTGGNVAPGYEIDTGTTRGTISNNTADECTSSGFEIDHADQINCYTNNAASSCGTGNTVASGHRYDGIHVRNGIAILVGNNVWNNRGHGIYVETGSAVLMGNWVQNNAAYTGAASDGIRIDVADAVLIGNRSRDIRGAQLQRYGINLTATSSGCLVRDNFVSGNLTAGLIDSGSSNVVRGNVGHTTESKGTATLTGDGSTAAFTIAHGLAAAPTYFNLRAKGAGGAGAWYWSADATNVTVTYLTAPPSGSHTVAWEAEV